MKKIAIFLSKDRLDIFTRYTVHIIIFDIINNDIKDINNEFLTKKDINYISLWLLKSDVQEIYVEDLDEQAQRYFDNIGIVVKTHEDIKSESLFNLS